MMASGRRSTRSLTALRRMSACSTSRRKSSKSTSTTGDHRAAGCFVSPEGFNQFRSLVKLGSEFTKEIVSILAERADAEAVYSKSISKLSARLLKNSSLGGSSSVSNAWHFIAEDMSVTADVHRTISMLITEAIVRPLKSFVEAQIKIRKSTESLVDKSAKNLEEWRSLELKSKIKSYSDCHDNERVQDQVLDTKLGRGRILSLKETLKLNNKKNKSEESLKRSDLHYYTSCIKAERARLEWQSSVVSGCVRLLRIEEQRHSQLRVLAEEYHQIMHQNFPKIITSINRLDEPVQKCNLDKDMEEIRKKADVGIVVSMGEQVLPIFYAEDETKAMNIERRRNALTKLVKILKADIDRERKAKTGVENLARALQETPKFGSDEAKADIKDKLNHIKTMSIYLEACRFKVLNALMDLDGKPRATHPLGSYIDKTTRDKAGMSRSILRVPEWASQAQEDDKFYSCAQLESLTMSVVGVGDRGAADGIDFPSDSEFDDDDVERTKSNDNVIELSDSLTRVVPGVGRCRALYDYIARMDDELTLCMGDIIEVHDRQEDGWWLGELNGTVGIFPATFVESI